MNEENRGCGDKACIPFFVHENTMMHYNRAMSYEEPWVDPEADNGQPFHMAHITAQKRDNTAPAWMDGIFPYPPNGSRKIAIQSLLRALPYKTMNGFRPACNVVVY